jgi:hypothetical protein
MPPAESITAARLTVHESPFVGLACNIAVNANTSDI